MSVSTWPSSTHLQTPPPCAQAQPCIHALQKSDILRFLHKPKQPFPTRAEAEHASSQFASLIVMLAALVPSHSAEAEAATSGSLSEGPSAPAAPEPIAEPRTSYGFTQESAGANGVAPFELVAIVDPLSTAAAKLSGLFLEVMAHFPVRLSVYLTPQQVIHEMPLKSYYSCVPGGAVQFDHSGNRKAAVATLMHLPATQVLSPSPVRCAS